MVYTNALRGSKSNGRSRRRGGTRRSSLTKTRYQPPTARNQKRQILSNQSAIKRLQRKTNRHLIYTDYQLSTTVQPVNNSWSVQWLMSFIQWNSVLRGDIGVQRGSHTFLKRMQMNLRWVLNGADYVSFSCFIITPRRWVADRIFDAAIPGSTPPVLNEDYIESPFSQGAMIRLNPSIFKVHWSRYITLTSSGLHQAAVPADTAGDPRTTWKKAQVNMPLNMKLSIPSFTAAQPSWMDKTFDSLPYFHKYQLIVYASWGGTGLGNPSFVSDALFTCINTD